MPPRLSKFNSVTIKTRRFLSNRLLGRKQMVVDVIHPNRAIISKADLRKKLAKMYNVKEPNTIILFGFKTDFGGGKSSGFGLIYDDIDTVKKFEPKHRLIPLNLKKKPALNRKQRKERKNKAKKFRGIRKYVGQKRQRKKED
eukprot:Anaeramoba_ignava/a349051_141.p1 GENE.a349051_141~~a349051_141.p1  ORF type:complete len:155 (+),score=52.14 a349051_141:41-466(+)